MVTIRAECQQSPLCCFRGCSVQDVGQSETAGWEQGGVKRRTHVRIFKVKDQLLKRLKKLFIIERRTLKT